MNRTVIEGLPPESFRDALNGLRREHLNVEGDCWFSCPLATHADGTSACCNDEPKQCNCGADTHNAIVTYLLSCVGVGAAEMMAEVIG